jgi:transcriptional regulator with XRE-family HTH domain
MAYEDLLEEALRRHISINVRTFRHVAGLTLKAASERAGIHWHQWQQIEAGTVGITIDTLARLAMALGVDASELVREPAPNVGAPTLH